ncbi:MAG: 2-oxoacid:acceptor oxidoreductase family protein [Candidatus Lokiarchaeota archaeon]|nr:2-oxoacid:acceptor oxidoreductase family protein [Candidatus Lokiarchaeota archaeon]
MDLNVLICGLGGQGGVFLGSFLRNYFLNQYPKAIILGTESRGVSQREGSVIATVRIQTNHEPQYIFSPEIPPMSADIVLALEPLELLRNFHVVHKHTIIVTNNEPVLPKSSVKGMFQNTNDEESINVTPYSKPEWVIAKIVSLMEKIPDEFDRRPILIQKNLTDTQKQPEIHLNSFSKHERIHDLNFYSLVLEQLEESKSLNFVMLGYVSTISEKILDFLLLQSYIKEFFKDNKPVRQKNVSALNYGKKLAEMRTKLEISP